MTDIFERMGAVSNWDGKKCDQYVPAEMETPVTQEIVSALFHVRRAKEQLEQGHDATWFRENAINLLKAVKECFELIESTGIEAAPSVAERKVSEIEDHRLELTRKTDRQI
jgi:hypothetical protein